MTRRDEEAAAWWHFIDHRMPVGRDVVDAGVAASARSPLHDRKAVNQARPGILDKRKVSPFMVPIRVSGLARLLRIDRTSQH